MWFGEVCSCCCLSLLPQLACNFLATTYEHIFSALYIHTPLFNSIIINQVGGEGRAVVEVDAGPGARRLRGLHPLRPLRLLPQREAKTTSRGLGRRRRRGHQQAHAHRHRELNLEPLVLVLVVSSDARLPAPCLLPTLQGLVCVSCFLPV